MRRVVTALAGVLLVLVTVTASAQTPPPDTVTEVNRQRCRPGTRKEYEAARVRHMGWHAAHNDPWPWDVYELVTGPDTGTYLIVSGGHQWQEMEQWNAKYFDEDNDAARAEMGTTIASTERAYWTQLNSLSRLPAPGERTPLSTVTYYHVKPGSDAAVRAAIGKLNATLEAGRYPLKTIWYVLTNGGPGPTYAVLVPRAGLGDMGPSPTLLDVLEKQLGKADSEALLKAFFDQVTGTNSEMLKRRPDLSYAPK
jgi:hypothetical protein